MAWHSLKYVSHKTAVNHSSFSMMCHLHDCENTNSESRTAGPITNNVADNGQQMIRYHSDIDHSTHFKIVLKCYIPGVYDSLLICF